MIANGSNRESTPFFLFVANFNGTPDQSFFPGENCLFLTISQRKNIGYPTSYNAFEAIKGFVKTQEDQDDGETLPMRLGQEFGE